MSYIEGPQSRLISELKQHSNLLQLSKGYFSSFDVIAKIQLMLGGIDVENLLTENF